MATINNIQNIRLSDIHVSNFNPRKRFPNEEMNELAESIKKNGVLQAILLRPMNEEYEIVFGERRYKASLLAGENTIPAIVREMSDKEAFEAALVENVKRQDLTPLEEAEFYQKLILNAQYDIPALCTQLGKSESYIRTRLKLSCLTTEFKELLDNFIIKVSIAFELTKYTEAQQEDIYNRHYKNENDYQSWRGLSTKETIARLEKALTHKLVNYNFDKTDCYTCPCNSNNQSLFPVEGECSNCSNLKCLKLKNSNFLVDRAKQIVDTNPQLIICHEHYNFDNEAKQQLEAQGYQLIETDYLSQYPVAPVKPSPEDYDNTDDYNTDLHEFYNEYGDYEATVKDLNGLFEQGKLKMYACLGDKSITLKYQKLTKQFDPIQDKLRQLTQKDKRNKEISVENTIADVKKELGETDFGQNDFSTFEEELLYFCMLSTIRKEDFQKLGINSDNYSLTDEQKMSIIKNLTEETKALIRRTYIMDGLKDSFGTSVKSDLLVEFAKQHIPEKLTEIKSKHLSTYEKRNQKIEEKKATILNPAPKTKKKDKKQVA